LKKSENFTNSLGYYIRGEVRIVPDAEMYLQGAKQYLPPALTEAEGALGDEGT